uniref:Uncharacterized protein n=1 Tax=viral metagenome TaxID=1070528 RepID=A0A6M3LLM9_9ZZZZ
MTPEQAKQNLWGLLIDGRISMNGRPLSGREIIQLQQSVVVLYAQGKDKEEDRKEDGNKEEK